MTCSIGKEYHMHITVMDGHGFTKYCKPLGSKELWKALRLLKTVTVTTDSLDPFSVRSCTDFFRLSCDHTHVDFSKRYIPKGSGSHRASVTVLVPNCEISSAWSERHCLAAAHYPAVVFLYSARGTFARVIIFCETNPL